MFLLALWVLNMCVRMCVCMCWRGDVKVQGGGCACGNWGGLKEKRPLLYKISCVSKGLTSSLPVVVIEAKLAECVAVVVKYGVGVEGWVGG